MSHDIYNLCLSVTEGMIDTNTRGLMVSVSAISVFRASENARNGRICALYPKITPLNRQQSVLFTPLKCNLGVKMGLINLTQGVRRFLFFSFFGFFFYSNWRNLTVFLK